VEGNRVQLLQVLLNLVLNACEAMAARDSLECQRLSLQRNLKEWGSGFLFAAESFRRTKETSGSRIILRAARHSTLACQQVVRR